MTKWNEQYLQAIKILAVAHAADQEAYDAIALESKTFWVAHPVECWPKVENYRVWYEARLALMQAEKTLVEILRWRCVAIRLGLPMHSITAGQADLVAPPYMEQRIDTVVEEIGLTHFMPMDSTDHVLLPKPDRPSLH
ncbi:MAG: hypothetical protein JWQ03_2804 [Variovorax sp.]|nr:hypothetical protein [Variovorax sp.]